MMISDTASQAEDFLGDVKRELESNILLIRDFPFACNKGTIWRQDTIVTNNGVKVMAFGTGSKIRGRKVGADRPDLVCLDDLESSDMVRSKSMRDFVRYQWFNKDLMPIGERGGVTDFLVVGTILGPASLLNALMDVSQYPDWTSKKFKAVIKFSTSDLWLKWKEIYKNRFDVNRKETARKFFEEHKEEMLEGTEILWPEGDTYYDLMIKQLADPSGFNSEYQNEPIDYNLVMVREDELHVENFATNKLIRSVLRSKNTPYYGALDPSLGKDSSSDYACIVTVARDIKHGFLYVVNISLKRHSVDKQIQEVLDKHLQYAYRKFAIETNAFQIVMKQALEKKSRKLGYYIPIVEVKNYSNKEMRIESLGPLLKDGTIVFDKARMKSNQEYALGVEMLCNWVPDGSSRFDDFLDALEICVRLAKGSRFKLLVKSNR